MRLTWTNILQAFAHKQPNLPTLFTAIKQHNHQGLVFLRLPAEVAFSAPCFPVFLSNNKSLPGVVGVLSVQKSLRRMLQAATKLLSLGSCVL